jgi:hypothetical protein
MTALREIRISKGPGKPPRVVVVPSARRKWECRRELPALTAAAMALDVHGVQHGFSPGRSPVTNARVHRGYAWTVCWDLAACFDHVLEQHVDAIETSDACWANGVARQGLPSSPAVANIALAPLDSAIVARLAGRGVYTRYADDLTISTNDRGVVDELLAVMPALVSAVGHEVAEHKTHVQSARAGRRVVTGVSVAHDLRPTREAKRKLRAARHRLVCLWMDALRWPALIPAVSWLLVRQVQIVQGMTEWTRLREPNWARAAMDRLQADDPVTAGLIAARSK